MSIPPDHLLLKAIKLSLIKGRLTGAVITDEQEHYKLSIIDEDAIPDSTIIRTASDELFNPCTDLK